MKKYYCSFCAQDCADIPAMYLYHFIHPSPFGKERYACEWHHANLSDVYTYIGKLKPLTCRRI